MSKPAEFDGTCAVCLGTYKVRGDRVVLHGYQRPGDGYINGRCFGENEPAWEVSPEAAQRFLDLIIAPSVERVTTLLQRYAAGTIELLMREQRVPYSARRAGMMPEQETLTPSHADWARECALKQANLENEQRYYLRMKLELEARIATWRLGELRPVSLVSKHVRLVFNPLRSVWSVRSVMSDRAIAEGRLVAKVLAEAASKGWGLPSGTEIPAEIPTIALYRQAAEAPEPKRPAAERPTDSRFDPTTAKVVVAVYEGLSTAEQGAFDVLNVWQVQGAIQKAGYHVAGVTVDSLRPHLRALVTKA